MPEDGITWSGDDPATYGPPDAGTWGPQREQRYRIRLRRGDRGTVIDAVLSIELTLAHSAVSALRAEVPRIPGLGDYKFGTVDLLYGDERLFRGRLLEWPGPGTGETATLAAPGPGQTLKRADLSVSFSGREAHDAIGEVWRDETPFTVTVVEPASPTTLSDFATEGSALEVLQTLHEQAGMRWTVQYARDTVDVESYVPSEVPKTQAWDAVEHGSTGQGFGYANTVKVYGGLDANGNRVTATAKDQAEIDALADDIGDGTVGARVDDELLTTEADAQARADTELADRLEQDELSGSLTIMPELVLPGYYYDIPEWATDGTTPTLPVDEVTIRESRSDAGVELSVNSPTGPVGLLARLDRGQAQLNQP